MLCIIAAYAVAVSVRPSIMFVYSIETNKHIFKIISLLGSHTILVFSYQTLWQYSDGDPLTGVTNGGGVKSAQTPPCDILFFFRLPRISRKSSDTYTV